MRDKQISEMAKVICHAPTCEIRKNGGTCYKYCKAYIYAFRAENAGYRKASEVVDEFIKLMIDSFGVNPYDRMNFDVRDLVELKKKYESEDKE